MSYLKNNWRLIFLLMMLFIQFSCNQKVDRRQEGALIDIVATDEGFRISKNILSGFNHVKFQNHGTTIHEAGFIKLPPNMNGEAYLEEVRKGNLFPEGAMDFAGPGLTSPGREIEMWLSLEPGLYLIACWHKGHLKEIPAQMMEVKNEQQSGIIPPFADLTIKMLDYRFELDKPIVIGDVVIKFETPGPSMHEIDIFKLNENKTIEDLRAWQKSGKQGVVPVVSIGGVLDNHDLTRKVWMRTNFDPGRYVLWCNMDMTDSTNTSHADAGMFYEFTLESN